jgi:hypothetical protein
MLLVDRSDTCVKRDIESLENKRKHKTQKLAECNDILLVFILKPTIRK